MLNNIKLDNHTKHQVKIPSPPFSCELGSYVVGKVDVAGTPHELERDIEAVRGTPSKRLAVLELVEAGSESTAKFREFCFKVPVGNRHVVAVQLRNKLVLRIEYHDVRRGDVVQRPRQGGSNATGGGHHILHPKAHVVIPSGHWLPRRVLMRRVPDQSLNHEAQVELGDRALKATTTRIT